MHETLVASRKWLIWIISSLFVRTSVYPILCGIMTTRISSTRLLIIVWCPCLLCFWMSVLLFFFQLYKIQNSYDFLLDLVFSNSNDLVVKMYLKYVVSEDCSSMIWGFLEHRPSCVLEDWEDYNPPLHIKIGRRRRRCIDYVI